MVNGITSDSASSSGHAMRKVLVRASVAAAAMLMPALALAGSNYLPDPDALSLAPAVERPATDSSELSQGSSETPVFLDAAAPPTEQPNIHGFTAVAFKTSYTTPRGLVVQNAGVNIQPVVGLILPIGDLGPIKGFTIVSGIWNSITSAQGDPLVGPWNEMDYFVSFSGSPVEGLSLTYTYSPWNFPNSSLAKPSTEHTTDLKIQYDDGALWNKAFSLNPYADIFYEISGSSTVTFGKNGNTGYLELGIAPTYTLKVMPDYPLSITLPTYFSVGPKEYWGRGGTIGGLSARSSANFGLASISLNLSVPMTFIPVRYGHWHADAGVTYDYLINSALLNAGHFLSGNTDRNVVIGSVGLGVNF